MEIINSLQLKLKKVHYAYFRGFFTYLISTSGEMVICKGTSEVTIPFSSFSSFSPSFLSFFPSPPSLFPFSPSLLPSFFPSPPTLLLSFPPFFLLLLLSFPASLLFPFSSYSPSLLPSFFHSLLPAFSLPSILFCFPTFSLVPLIPLPFPFPLSSPLFPFSPPFYIHSASPLPSSSPLCFLLFLFSLPFLFLLCVFLKCKGSLCAFGNCEDRYKEKETKRSEER